VKNLSPEWYDATMKNKCQDCNKEVKLKTYRYIILNDDRRVLYYGFERINENGSYLASRAHMQHGHYPAPRIVTPPDQVYIEKVTGTIEVLVIP
jgi:hypothetical protein